MKTITTTVYEFNELSDKAKEKARDWYRQASAHDEWWEYVYDDAKEVGIKITAFDIGRANSIEGEFLVTPIETIDRIKAKKGETTDTHKTAVRYEPSFRLPVDTEADEERYDNDAHEFLTDLLEDYLVILRKELEYVESDENVDENIMANEYTFTESGKREG